MLLTISNYELRYQVFSQRQEASPRVGEMPKALASQTLQRSYAVRAASLLGEGFTLRYRASLRITNYELLCRLR